MDYPQVLNVKSLRGVHTSTLYCKDMLNVLL